MPVQPAQWRVNLYRIPWLRPVIDTLKAWGESHQERLSCAAEASAPPHFRFGLRGTHQEITSGIGLTGFDVEAAWLVTANFQLAARRSGEAGRKIGNGIEACLCRQTRPSAL